jgi:putative membrane protein
MNKKFKKAIALAISTSMIFTSTSFASSNIINKNETVYVVQENDKVEEKLVSVWLNSSGNIEGKDMTDLKDIKNLSNDQEVKSDKGYIDWKEKTNDVYYQGKSDRDLPVDVKIEYYLDGAKTTNADLKGKSGHLKMVIKTENKNFVNKDISGKNTKIYAPYVVANVMTFNKENASNIKAEDSKISKDGKNQVIATVLTPGLKENFSSILEEDKLKDFKDEAVIEMDINNYQPIEAYAVITNEIFQKDLQIDSFDKLLDGINQLEDNSQKLVDGSLKLSQAQDKLSDGLGQLNEGAEKLSSGTQELYDKTGLLEEKIAGASENMKNLPGIIGQMSDGANSLNQGINQYTSAVSTINENTEKLKVGAGMLSQGTEELDGGLERLKMATASLSQAADQFGDFSNMEDGIFARLGQLKTGLADLSEGATKLDQGLGQALEGSKTLAEKNQEFDENLQAMNKQVQTMDLDLNIDTSSLNLEEDLTNIALSAQTLASSIDDIQDVILLLSQNEDENSQTAVAILTNTCAELGQNAQNIGQSAQNLGQNLEALSGISEKMGSLNQITELKEGLDRLAEVSGQINTGIQSLPQGLEEVKNGSSALKEGADQIYQGLEEGQAEMTDNIDMSDINKFTQGLKEVDQATGQLKEGSSTLKEKTKESQAGVEMLADALAELDANSENLVDGSYQLAGGLNEFKERSAMLGDLTKLNDQGLTPLRAGIQQLNSGAKELSNGSSRLNEGSKELSTSMKTFSDKLLEFKEKGIDQIGNKTEDLPKTKEILDTISDLAKEDDSFTGQADGFETSYRIVEKIK